MEKGLNELSKWINSFEIIGEELTVSMIKNKIKEIKKKSSVAKTKNSTPQIYFRESKWSNYQTLRDDLLKDKEFVKEYVGVDLMAYIDQAISWSEKGNKSTDLGWKMTLKNWMRKAKQEGTLVVKKKKEKLNLFTNH